jgi:aspartyl-tRNA(Asn)/glutamyl-tRNA(Gln) amidotransferase subunit C
MHLSDEEIKHLFKLARIKFDESHVVKLQKKLDNVLGFIEQVNQVDCKDIEPMYSVSLVNDALREDEPIVQVSLDNLFDNLPPEERNFSKQSGYFRVKKDKL